MTTDFHTEPSTNQLPETIRGIARRGADAARETQHKANVAAHDAASAADDAAADVSNSAKAAAEDATNTAREMYQSASLRAGDALATSRAYVQRNPVPVVLGAVAFGAALGYLLMTARRKPTFSERYADEPMAAVREAVFSALAPVTQRVHRGYDSARHGAGKALERVHELGSGRNGDSFSDHIGRIGNNLKFW